ncbi:MAG: hypothetical protein ACP5XB_19880 [Isosphaeraceae bacterium]
MIWLSPVVALVPAVLCYPGDSRKDLVDLITQAQKANQSRHPSGELHAALKTDQEGRPSIHDHADIHAIWSGDRIWTELKGWTHHLHEVDPQQVPADELLQFIVDQTRCIVYHPGGKRVIISPRVKNPPPGEALMRPQDCWYVALGLKENANLNWYHLLEPRLVRGIDASKIHFDAVRKSDDIIEVTRRDDKEGGSVWMAFSLAREGNAVAFELKEPVSNFSCGGKCEWAQDGSGRLYLARSIYEEHGEIKGERYTRRLTYETKSFLPGARIDLRRFEVASFKPPPGTMISDEVAGRNTRIGDLPVVGVKGQLDPLIELIRSRGFASPAR